MCHEMLSIYVDTLKKCYFVLILFKVNCLKITFLENILTAIILFLVVVKSEVFLYCYFYQYTTF